MTTCFRCRRPIRGTVLMGFPPKPVGNVPWRPLPNVLMCLECGGNGHNVLTADEVLRATRTEDDLFGPATPYPEPGGQETTGGWSGTDTSQDRARREARDGTLTARQQAVRKVLAARGTTGATVKEVRETLDLHHGQASGALSNLHHTGVICMLDAKRHRCHVYVLPDFVAGRPVVQPRRNRKEEPDA